RPRQRARRRDRHACGAAREERGLPGNRWLADVARGGRMSAPQAKPPAAAAQAKPGHPPAAPPRDMFGGRMIGGLGMPTHKAKNFKGTLNRLLGYLRPHRAVLIVITLAGAVGTVFQVVGPKVLGKATTKIFEGFVAKARGIPGAHVDFDYVGRILAWLVVLYIIGNAFQYLMQFLM